MLGIRADDRVYSAAKLFFAYGLGNALTFPLCAGATAILCAERPTVSTVSRVANETEVGYLQQGGVLPKVLRDLMA